jgi:hypothetical protein
MELLSTTLLLDWLLIDGKRLSSHVVKDWLLLDGKGLNSHVVKRAEGG